ncbi:alpha-amylase family glycosyl hydrolase [Massilia sp. TSP1-1-2]|uniref:alpha-amylase family glycosyl hydrolase n=1 Tax=unclassified Massilia TaxID=2609279 RepID=UPI003CF7D8FC
MKTIPRVLSAASLALACLPALAQHGANAAQPPATMAHVAWSRNANIYEVNIRQFTREGTINAFAADLPRLKKMGVDILWIMPVQPIGQKNRKGSLGSYYAVRDYTAVNPEFGSMADFKAMVAQAHKLGMHVILDWVANHTAWDNTWVAQHNDWYKKNEKGDIFPVTFNEGGNVEYWTDVIALDYTKPALWQGMTQAMAFWLREADIDGFRCDVAGLVPVAFWNHARAELDKIKPVFMLAEWAEPALHEQAFDMTYDWALADIFKKVGKGNADARDIVAYISKPEKVFPSHAMRMLFTNNHDFNSWHGTDRALYGPAYQALAVVAATLPGMPLIYNGQESALDKQLAFFEKDPIAWDSYRLTDFYSGLLKVKRDNPAMANGQYGAPATFSATGNDKVLAYKRVLGTNVVEVVVNLSAERQSFTLDGAKAAPLAAWTWRIKTKQ